MKWHFCARRLSWLQRPMELEWMKSDVHEGFIIFIDLVTCFSVGEGLIAFT